MKKKLKQSIAVIAVCVLVRCGGKLLDDLLIDDTASYTRLMMHEFYEQDDIDILMVGASHCFGGIAPSIVEENTGKSVFLASSSSQPPDVSFALIKEAVKFYDIEQIYLEISAAIAVGTGSYKERTDMTQVYLISDYMRPSLNRVSLLLGASSPEYYLNGFWYAKRTGVETFSWERVASVLSKKRTDLYREFGYDYAGNDHQTYVGNGYIAESYQIEPSKYYNNSGNNARIDTGMISNDWCDTILDMIDFCRKKNIKLTFYAAPVSNFQLAASGNYDEYIAYVKDLVDGKAVEYVDFNLLKEDYLPYLTTNFSDGDHLNMYGAEAFSKIFSDYVNNELPREAFYGSVREKLEKTEPEYYGIAYRDDTDGQRIRLISNHPGKLEYKVEMAYDDRESLLFQDFSQNSQLCIPYDQLGTIVVTYRLIGNGEEVSIRYDA